VTPQVASALLWHGPLPCGGEALYEPFSAFPSWFLRVECDRCGKVQMANEAHARWRDRTLRTILAKMRHDGCSGIAAKAELLTGVDGVSARPVRRIVLISNPVLTAAPFRTGRSQVSTYRKNCHRGRFLPSAKAKPRL
jgi:hypothetical protein